MPGNLVSQKRIRVLRGQRRSQARSASRRTLQTIARLRTCDPAPNSSFRERIRKPRIRQECIVRERVEKCFQRVLVFLAQVEPAWLIGY